MVKSLRYILFLLNEYIKMKAIEKWPKERIQNLQIRRLNEIFQIAKKIPFYNKYYKKHGVFNLVISQMDDLKKIPTINKSRIRNIKIEDITSIKNKKEILCTPTSGSTGEPLLIYIDKRIEMIPPVKVINAMKQFGWNLFDKGLEIWREDKATHKNFMRKLGLLDSISVFEPIEEIAEKIIDKNPNYLFCSRSFYMILAEYFKKHNLKILPKYLLCTAEVVLEEHRKELEETFNTKLLNIYGCMECPTIAGSCPEENNLHVFQSTCIVEYDNISEENGEEFGDIIVTNLTNMVMPFVRYKNGDRGKIISSPCQCGRNTQILGDIIGRDNDDIKLSDGRFFNYLHFYQIFRGEKIIKQYKIIQRNVDELMFQFKLKEKYRKTNAKKYLHSLIDKHFDKLNFKIEFVEQFTMPKSGKFKVIERIL